MSVSNSTMNAKGGSQYILMGREMVLQLAMDGEGDTMTIEGQQQAIREGLAEEIPDACETGCMEPIGECGFVGPEYLCVFRYKKADSILAFLTEKGAVLHHELTSRYATCICYPLICYPLIEKK